MRFFSTGLCSASITLLYSNALGQKFARSQTRRRRGPRRIVTPPTSEPARGPFAAAPPRAPLAPPRAAPARTLLHDSALLSLLPSHSTSSPPALLLTAAAELDRPASASAPAPASAHPGARRPAERRRARSGLGATGPRGRSLSLLQAPSPRSLAPRSLAASRCRPRACVTGTSGLEAARGAGASRTKKWVGGEVRSRRRGGARRAPAGARRGGVARAGSPARCLRAAAWAWHGRRSVRSRGGPARWEAGRRGPGGYRAEGWGRGVPGRRRGRAGGGRQPEVTCPISTG
jgi:hypothetical protein